MPELSTVWFWLVATLLTLWAVLDGFDFGVGVLHRYVARTDAERRQVLGSIGPVWDGNEVWLIAAGGSLFLAFPRLLAAGMSGLYLPVIFTAWCLILRGASIELRNHLDGALWRSFFDTTLMLGSAGVPVLLGAALGNVVRGVPLQPDGYFELPLFSTDGEPGVFDGYTVLIAVLVSLTLTAHGANWLVLKTGGEVQQRALRARLPLWGATAITWAASIYATTRVWPEALSQFSQRPIAWLGLAAAFSGLAVIFVKRREELRPFFGGVAFISGLMVVTVGTLFPTVLRALVNENALTVTTAASNATSMTAALFWWLPGIGAAAAYYWWVLRHFRGKVT